MVLHSRYQKGRRGLYGLCYGTSAKGYQTAAIGTMACWSLFLQALLVRKIGLVKDGKSYGVDLMSQVTHYCFLRCFETF